MGEGHCRHSIAAAQKVVKLSTVPAECLLEKGTGSLKVGRNVVNMCFIRDQSLGLFGAYFSEDIYHKDQVVLNRL